MTRTNHTTGDRESGRKARSGLRRKTLVIAAGVFTLGLTGIVGTTLADPGRGGPAFVAGEGGHSGRGHPGRSAGRGPHPFAVVERFDANGDGRVTQAEIDGERAGKLARFDTDGDAVVTGDEFAAPRRHAVARFDRNGDGAFGPDDLRNRFPGATRGGRTE